MRPLVFVLIQQEEDAEALFSSTVRGNNFVQWLVYLLFISPYFCVALKSCKPMSKLKKFREVRLVYCLLFQKVWSIKFIGMTMMLKTPYFAYKSLV